MTMFLRVITCCRTVAIVGALMLLMACGKDSGTAGDDKTGSTGILATEDSAKARACMEAQDKMDAAVDNWAIDNGKKSGDQPTEADIVGKDKFAKAPPMCPSGAPGGTKIAIPAVGANSVCPCGIASHKRAK